MTTNNSPFNLKSIADKKLMRLALAVHEWIRLPNQPKCDLAIHFPLSQAINPISPEICKYNMKGFILNATIPLAILTPFPEGELLVAVFDINSEDDLITKILEKTGVKVIVSDDFSKLTPRHIKDAISSKREPKLYLSKAVNPMQFKAYEIIANRVEPLKEYSPFLLLHEVMASSVASIKQNAAHTNRASWEETWNHVSKSPFDCLVVLKDDMYPLLALEFDGRHHKVDENQKRKDALKNEYCNKLSLPLIRIDDTYLNTFSTTELSKYGRSGFLQGLIIELLCYSFKDRSELLQSIKETSKYFNKLRDGMPDATSETLLDSYLGDEERRLDDQFKQQIDLINANYLSKEFERIYNIVPTIKFEKDKFDKTNTTLALPSIGLKPALILTCPTAVKAEIYGINNPDAFVNDYMSTYLLELAIAAGS